MRAGLGDTQLEPGAGTPSPSTQLLGLPYRVAAELPEAGDAWTFCCVPGVRAVTGSAQMQEWGDTPHLSGGRESECLWLVPVPCPPPCLPLPVQATPWKPLGASI